MLNILKNNLKNQKVNVKYIKKQFKESKSKGLNNINLNNYITFIRNIIYIIFYF